MARADLIITPCPDLLIHSTSHIGLLGLLSTWMMDGIPITDWREVIIIYTRLNRTFPRYCTVSQQLSLELCILICSCIIAIDCKVGIFRFAKMRHVARELPSKEWNQIPAMTAKTLETRCFRGRDQRSFSPVTPKSSAFSPLIPAGCTIHQGFPCIRARLHQFGADSSLIRLDTGLYQAAVPWSVRQIEL